MIYKNKNINLFQELWDNWKYGNINKDKELYTSHVFIHQDILNRLDKDTRSKVIREAPLVVTIETNDGKKGNFYAIRKIEQLDLLSKLPKELSDNLQQTSRNIEFLLRKAIAGREEVVKNNNISKLEFIDRKAKKALVVKYDPNTGKMLDVNKVEVTKPEVNKILGVAGVGVLNPTVSEKEKETPEETVLKETTSLLPLTALTDSATSSTPESVSVVSSSGGSDGGEGKGGGGSVGGDRGSSGGPPGETPPTRKPNYFADLFSKQRLPGILTGSALSLAPFFFTKNPVIRVLAGTTLYGLGSYGISRLVTRDKMDPRTSHEFSLGTTLKGLPVAGATMGLGFLTEYLINKIGKRRKR